MASIHRFLKQDQNNAIVFNSEALNGEGFKHHSDLPAELALEVAESVYKLLEANLTNSTLLITCDVHDFATKTKANVDISPASPTFVCSPHLVVKNNGLTISVNPSTLSEEEKKCLANSIHYYVLQAHLQGVEAPHMLCAAHDFYALNFASNDETTVTIPLHTSTKPFSLF